MNRLAAALALVLVAAVTGTSPSSARATDGIDWGISNWVAGVQMTTSFPSVTDPHLHVRFKRVGGEGQRQVRMGERDKVEGSHHWAPYRYTGAVKLQVGEKVVFTTERAVPCAPPKEPLGISVEMRIKAPGKAWSRWVTWIREDHILPDCND
jgi:hypothetical protein